MIGGASQADIGILVISARKGEYETGFEKGGQTREHAILAKTQVGVLLLSVFAFQKKLAYGGLLTSDVLLSPKKKFHVFLEERS